MLIAIWAKNSPSIHLRIPGLASVHRSIHHLSILRRRYAHLFLEEPGEIAEILEAAGDEGLGDAQVFVPKGIFEPIYLDFSVIAVRGHPRMPLE